jgi:hypothetical protein
MNSQDLQKKLMAAARATPPSDAVPFAFEKRVMAILRDHSPENPVTGWVQAFWRGAIASVAVAMICGAWLTFYDSNNSELSQDLEHTIMASLDEDSGL